MKPLYPKFSSQIMARLASQRNTHRTALGECESDNEELISTEPSLPAKMTTYPSKCDQGPSLRKLRHKLLLIDHACITRRMLLRNQQGRNYIAPSIISTKQQ